MTYHSGWTDSNPIAGQIATLLSQPQSDSDIHIWRASLASSPQSLAHFASLLSPDEKARVNRFIFEKDRKHYTIGRGILRTLLGSYLDMESSEVKISYGPQGKPFVDSTHNKTTLEFNLSHSN